MSSRAVARRAASASFFAVPPLEPLEKRTLLAVVNGLTGAYFHNANLTDAAGTRVDATVNFDWALGSPASNMQPDTFSVRWTGQVQAKSTGTYRFYTTTDDGVRLWVNGALLVDAWRNQSATEYSGTIALVAGQRYSVKMEYYENTGSASAKLRWSGPEVAKEIIPSSHLFTETVTAAPAAPTGLKATATSSASIALTWSNVAEETGYKIERRRDGTTDPWTQIATTGANVTSYTNSGLSPSTTYLYRVRAYNAAGNSPYSAVAWATTPNTTTPPAQTPFFGVPFNVTKGATTTIQAEDFDKGGQGVAFNDTTATNLGCVYRETAVDIVATTDAGGGYLVGYSKSGEWLEYTINVAETGTYDLAFRVAQPTAGGTFRAEIDGVNVTGALAIPNTGDWQTFQTVTKSGVTISGGQHVLRLFLDGGAANGSVGNFNWIKIGAPPSPPPPPPPPTSPTYDLAFSTYLGGSAYEQARDITTDAAGNIYVTGGGESSNFPTTLGAFDRTANGNFDVFVTKYSPSGQLIWSTLLGGPEYDRAYAIEVDASGYVYIAGRAGQGLPTTAGAFQPTYNGHYSGAAYGNQNAFVAKLKPDGSELVFASYFGSYELIRDLAIDSSGDIYVGGSHKPTETGAPPPAAWFANAFQKTPNAGWDTVVAKIKSDGSQLLWATYYGGAGNDGAAPSIRVDSLNRPVVVGTTNSLDLATTAGAYDRTHNGGVDMFVAKFAADGSQLVYGTYVGGSGNEGTETHNLALDSAGNPYVTGYTSSTNLPTTLNALQRTYGGGANDAFITKLSADGSTLLASTYYGGAGGEGSEGVNIDAAGNVYISGPTNSTNLRMTSDAYRATNAGLSDMFVAKLSSNLDVLKYASYLGGPGQDAARASWVDSAGNIYVTGHVEGGFVIKNAAQPLYGGATDNGIAKFVIL